MNLINEKLKIAERAGVLHQEISRLSNLAERIERKKTSPVRDGHKYPEGITVRVYLDDSSDNTLRSQELDPGGTSLHDALLEFLTEQINKRARELNDLIKIAQ